MHLYSLDIRSKSTKVTEELRCKMYAAYGGWILLMNHEETVLILVHIRHKKTWGFWNVDLEKNGESQLDRT